MYKDIAWTKYDSDKNEYYEHDINRINRVFATTNPKYGKLVKMHEKKTTYDSVEGLPDKCEVINTDIRNKLIGDIENIDYDWYIQVAKDRIIDFLLTPEDKKRIKLQAKEIITQYKDEAKAQKIAYKKYLEQINLTEIELKQKVIDTEEKMIWDEVLSKLEKGADI